MTSPPMNMRALVDVQSVVCVRDVAVVEQEVVVDRRQPGQRRRAPVKLAHVAERNQLGRLLQRRRRPMWPGSRRRCELPDLG